MIIFLVLNSELENKVLNTILYVLECNHYFVEKKIQNFTSLFETNEKTETLKPKEKWSSLISVEILWIEYASRR